MRLIPTDPDIATIVSRIRNGDIDLQPAFQRGEVWSKLKQQRLVDTILRDWHIPPIHVIENPVTKKQEVLDGQQRLAAIRDFVNGKVAIDGQIEPREAEIEALDGMAYHDLPVDWRRRFDQFAIRIFRIVDYKSTEPAEIFYRLNQPAALTAAEQRNAFFGPVREQIKQFVTQLEAAKFSSSARGFSNTRGSYDEVLSRAALALERSTISEKITSTALADLYRASIPLSERTVSLMERAIDLLGNATRVSEATGSKFNKATLFSWFMFVARQRPVKFPSDSADHLEVFMSLFEARRQSRKYPVHDAAGSRGGVLDRSGVFAVYDSRSSARVADVSSVILRDAIIWLVFGDFLPMMNKSVDAPDGWLLKLRSAFIHGQPIEDDLVAKNLIECGWGQLI